MGAFKNLVIIIGIIILALLAIALGSALIKHLVSPVNDKPVISLDNTVINATVGDPIIINATVTDDGEILTSIWDQEAGPKSNFTQISNDLYFTPKTNGTYIFKLEVQDDKHAITTLGVQVNVDSIPPPPKPTCNTNQVYNPATNKCDPKPVPPPPKPVVKDITVTITADVEEGAAGNAVFEQIKKRNATYDFVLGDLGYESNLEWFKKTYGSLGDKMWCVMGNHEADNEDGSAKLEKETLDFCGNSYWLKYYSTLFLMYNTNENQNTLIDVTKKVLANSTIMNGVKNIHINGHKGCAVPPNSHHQAGEIKVFCDYLKSNIPSNIKVLYNSAHNHVLSASADGTYKQSGAGGKSHYTCGVNAAFPYCDNIHYGFLLYTIKADGTTTSQFIDSKGAVIK